jgi:2',3'-cyclic-nucleotide 2'-phosphodiesterase (5'-nucleotidase family)
VENAIGIESHDNRYYYDTVTVRFDNLMGGFIDGEYFVPVRFGLKQSVDGHIALYVVVDQNKIDLEKIRNKKTEVIKAASPHEVESSTSRSVSYSISQIIPSVNSVDVLRYIPDNMLTNEQKNVKYQGIADTIRYTNEKNDRKYSKYISENKLDAAKQMVRLAALANGYIFQQSETEREGIWIHSETGQVKSGAVITYDDNGNVIPLSERFKEDNSDIRYSIDEEPDTADLADVERGDKETAQKMVDEAAKRAGYDIKAYHGTTNQEEHRKWDSKRNEWETTYTPFTVFKRQYDEQAGHFFSSDESNAGGYGSYLYSVYLMLKKPLVIECNGQSYNSISFDGQEMDTYEWAEYARKRRYDGVVFKNVRDGVGYADLTAPTTDYVVFDSNRIKSADPVTYDNNGDIIPLSERFKVIQRDIRYSIDETPENADVSENRDLTDREILGMALEGAVQNEDEWKIVKSYREQAAILELVREKRDGYIKEANALERQIKALRARMEDKGDPDGWIRKAMDDAIAKKREAERMRDEQVKILDNADRELLRMKADKPFREILARERKRVRTAEYVSNDIYDDYDSDPLVSLLLEKYKTQVEIGNRVVGNNPSYRSSSSIKQLVADLYYEAGVEYWGDEYDIAVGGGFISVRSPYELGKGPVTYGTLQMLLPFDNRLVLCSIKGSDLQKRFISTSNDNYYVHCDKSITNNLDPNGTYYIVTDTYCSGYAPNRLTVVAEYTEGVYARDLVADWLGKQ